MIEGARKKTSPEVAELLRRLEDAEETLRAITGGEVDALVVHTKLGERVFTLQGADAIYRVAIENINEGAITLSPEGTILYSNRYFAEMLGVELNRVIGTSIYDFVDPEDRHQIGGILRQESGRVEVTIRSGAIQVPTFIATRKLNMDNEAICAIVTDLTQQKRNEELIRSGEQLRRTEAALRLAKEQLDAAFLNSPVIAFGQDCDLRHSWLYNPNPSLGRTSVIGKTDEELFGSQARAMMELKRRVIDTGKNARGVFELCANGTKFYHDISIKPVLDHSGKVTGIVCAAIDITERKKTEEELRERTADLENANRDLESFSYSVSHDLKAPLRALDGFSEAVLLDYADKLDEQGRGYLNRVRTASKTMSQLIDGMLSLSRVARLEAHLEKVDLSDIAQTIVETLKSSQPEREAEITIAPHITANGDIQLLKILLKNLLENAWKFTSRLGMTRIAFGVKEENSEKVYYVRDNGAGFDMKYADKLFLPFQRLHSSDEFPGMGIGLATARRVIARHRGRIWAESEPGEGATFYFTLE